MKLSAAVISSLAIFAFAAPAPVSESQAPQRANHARQERTNRNSRMMNKRRVPGPWSSGWQNQGSSTPPNAASEGYRAATSTSTSAAAAVTKQSSSSNDDYNANWAGVVVQGDKGSVTGVSGTFTLPKIGQPTTGDQLNASDHSVVTWVGIDGYGCGAGLWQSGVKGSIDQSGTISWSAWYEWYPDYPITVDIGDLATGDVITVNLTASSTTEGTVTISNAANGKTFTKTVTSTAELCLENAEWIAEDIVVDDPVNIGLASFSSITFTDAIATTKNGTTLSPGDNPIFNDIEDDENTPLTSSSSIGNTVTIECL